MKHKLLNLRRKAGSERGSLALEHVLFIGAIVAMSAGIWAFYGDLGNYFSGFDIVDPPEGGFGGGPGTSPTP